MSKNLNSRFRPNKHEINKATYPSILINMALLRVLQSTPIV